MRVKQHDWVFFVVLSVGLHITSRKCKNKRYCKIGTILLCL